MRRIEYKTEKERQDIFVGKKETEYWIKEESTAEGNFITFADTPLKNTDDMLNELSIENIALKAEKEVLLQTIAEKEDIIQMKSIEVEEIKNMAGMVPDPKAR